MGGGGPSTISRICCRRSFFARFQFGDRTRREVRRRQAEARPELTSVVIKTQTSDKVQGHQGHLGQGPRTHACGEDIWLNGLESVSYTGSPTLIYRRWRMVKCKVERRSRVGVGKVQLQLHQVLKNFCSLVQVTVHCLPALVITLH